MDKVKCKVCGLMVSKPTSKRHEARCSGDASKESARLLKSRERKAKYRQKSLESLQVKSHCTHEINFCPQCGFPILALLAIMGQLNKS